MEDIRWKQRFENFEKAFEKLKLVHSELIKNPNNELMQMAIIQAFEFNYELGWKTLRDYLKYSGHVIKLARDTIKEAYANNIIQNGQDWIDMIEDRNLTSHAYSQKIADKVVNNILYKYVPAFEQLNIYLKGKL